MHLVQIDTGAKGSTLMAGIARTRSFVLSITTTSILTVDPRPSRQPVRRGAGRRAGRQDDA
jgi:hypothetical protein